MNSHLVTVWKPSIRVIIGDFLSCVTSKFDRWPWKTIGHLFYVASSFVHDFIPISKFKLELQSGNAKFRGKICYFFVPCDLGIWWMTLKNNWALLLYYAKLCASFHSHLWNQTWVAIRKRSIRLKISNFLSRVTSKFDRWPWKTIGHLFYAASSFVHHFIASHQWIQAGVTVQKLSIQVKIGEFLSCATLKFDRWPWKTIGHLYQATSTFVHHFIIICKFQLELVWKLLNWVLTSVTLTFDFDLLCGHHFCYWL